MRDNENLVFVLLLFAGAGQGARRSGSRESEAVSKSAANVQANEK
jgi:hypothetical protein